MRPTIGFCLAAFVAASKAAPFWSAPVFIHPSPPESSNLAQTEQQKSPEAAALSSLEKRKAAPIFIRPPEKGNLAQESPEVAALEKRKATPIFIRPPEEGNLAQTEQQESPEVADLSGLAKRESPSPSEHAKASKGADKGNLKGLLKPFKSLAERLKKRFYYGQCCSFTYIKTNPHRFHMSMPIEAKPPLTELHLLLAEDKRPLPEGYHWGVPGDKKRRSSRLR